VVQSAAAGDELDSATRSERLWKLAPAAVGLLALALGLIGLGSAPLAYDERVTIHSAAYPLGGIWNLAQHTEAPHAAYYVLIKPWLAAFGDASWVARLPSVVFGALAAATTTMLGTRLFDRLAGLAAGILLATSTYFIGWSQQVRGYALAALLATVATYAFVRALEGVDGRWWALWAVAAVGAAWASLFAASVLLAHVVAVIVVRPRPPARIPLRAAGVVVVATTPIVVLVASNEKDQVNWIPSLSWHWVRVNVENWTGENPLVLVAAALGVAGLARGAVAGSSAWKTTLLCAWVAAPFAVTLVLSAFQPAFLARYLVSAAPALALLAGAGVASLRRWPGLLAAGALLVFAGIRLVHLYH
jgi:mannosyltransferase